jgi:two-component sensor histidine kinase
MSSIREKEALVKEVHHRVKNNLQMMASLLNLQRHASALPAVHVAIDEARARIASIALLHEKLYVAADLAHVDGGEYLRDLAQRLAAELAPTGHVNVEADADPVPLSADRAIPCGLIVNELVTNAIKHAFPHGEGGRVHISLRASAAEIRLCVGDDGVGLPAAIQPTDSPGVGLQLVAAFVEQLDATLTVDRGHGTRFDIRFPVVR